MILGDKLRLLIEENDLTQKQFADKLGISPSTLGGYIQNRREPDYETLKQIASTLNVSIDYLLDSSFKQHITDDEAELLRVFRGLNSEQQRIYIEQGKAFSRITGSQKSKK